MALAEMCSEEKPVLLFDAAKSFQKDVARRCNPDGANPTQVMYMGVIPMSEAKAVSCGGLTLDLLLKFGVLVREVDGTIKLADDYEAKICYIVGDVKTVDNMDKIIRDIADRTLTAEETFDLAEVFEKALKRLIIIPGDWHAGLTMVQSIFNIFGIRFWNLSRLI